MSADRPNAFAGVYEDASVLVTGHTGFKGAWLCEWLLALGARVTGFALAPETDPSLFAQLGLAARVAHAVGDVRAADAVRDVVERTRPDFVFHLAAQPLVRRSYREPVETWETNVLGTIHVLEALRRLEKPCAAVMVTTDKCYENHEWAYRYRENDAIGGHDPYSSSKGAAEVAIASWRRSFFEPGHPVRIASARAGNVIGGGDWAEDRIVPDAMRALADGRAVSVRNPGATRPWQHVLEPVSGYLALAAGLASRPDDPRLASAFNIGPDPDANRTVRDLVETVLQHWPGRWQEAAGSRGLHEAALLQLDNGKIQAVLGWRPAWGFRESVERTVLWYRDVGRSPAAIIAPERTLQDIRVYERAARDRGVPWAARVRSPRSEPHHA